MCLVRSTLVPCIFFTTVDVMNKGLMIFAVSGG